MKNYFLLCAIALGSCVGQDNRNSEDTNKADEDTIHAMANRPVQNKPYCFIRTEGTGQQDTTKVRFTINGDKVEGEMSWIPKEKDSRKGVLTGTISNNEITALWNYMQEGMRDSIRMAFKLLPNDELAQKPLTINGASGIQETDEAAGYTVIYKSDHCND
ncbi:hypothetical protein [Sphingobacterium haloxyli]|uniref:Uncharacterized protein n=1 Tax=Sphingobacterium haloxyli TaxID=2100533 RepID=A0A2S9J6L2_9SPHI|nr:hypothetical protein [Sphingobacterium haloxyli]PRD48425.1 hypothetical protein C5745_04260 [Sphingobacterium haloxyli]